MALLHLSGQTGTAKHLRKYYSLSNKSLWYQFLPFKTQPQPHSKSRALRHAILRDLNPAFRGGHRDQQAAQKAEDAHINPPVDTEELPRPNFPQFPDEHKHQTTKTRHNHLLFPPYCSLIRKIWNRALPSSQERGPWVRRQQDMVPQPRLLVFEPPHWASPSCGKLWADCTIDPAQVGSKALTTQLGWPLGRVDMLDTVLHQVTPLTQRGNNYYFTVSTDYFIYFRRLNAFWLPGEGHGSHTKSIPGMVSTFPLSQNIQLSLIFFHLFPCL